MKKIILILCILLITGCSKEFKIEGDIKEIKYNDLTILEDEYNNIKDLINIEFEENKNIKNPNNKLTIKTDKDIYYYTLSDKYLIYDEYYAENKKLLPYLNGIKDKYHNTNFYTIDYIKNYDPSDSNINISLDKTSNYIIIKLTDKIKNFKINEIEYDDKYNDIDLLYSEENVSSDSIIIKKTVPYNAPDIRISFENIYNYSISIIPTYNKLTEEYEFITTYNMK